MVSQTAPLSVGDGPSLRARRKLLPVRPRADLVATASTSVWHALGDSLAFVHVLCSRFSIGQGRQSALVAARLALFVSICAPSIRAQTDGRFVWLLYVDESLLPADRTALEEAVRGIAGAHIVALPKDGEHAAAYEAPCLRQISLAGLPTDPPSALSGAHRRLPGADRRERGGQRELERASPTARRRRVYLTSRLDADDALDSSFFAAVHGRVASAAAGGGGDGGGADGFPLYLCHLHALAWLPSTTAGSGIVSTEAASPPAVDSFSGRRLARRLICSSTSVGCDRLVALPHARPHKGKLLEARARAPMRKRIPPPTRPSPLALPACLHRLHRLPASPSLPPRPTRLPRRPPSGTPRPRREARSVHAVSHTEVRKGSRRVALLDSGERWSGPVRARTVTSDGLKGVRSARETAVGGGGEGKRAGAPARDADDGTVPWAARYGISPAELRRANEELTRLEARVAEERVSPDGNDCVADFSCALHLGKKAPARLARLTKLAKGKLKKGRSSRRESSLSSRRPSRRRGEPGSAHDSAELRRHRSRD